MGATSFVKLGVANAIDANVALAASSRILPPFSSAMSQSASYNRRANSGVLHDLIAYEFGPPCGIAGGRGTMTLSGSSRRTQLRKTESMPEDRGLWLCLPSRRDHRVITTPSPARSLIRRVRSFRMPRWKSETRKPARSIRLRVGHAIHQRLPPVS